MRLGPPWTQPRVLLDASCNTHLDFESSLSLQYSHALVMHAGDAHPQHAILARCFMTSHGELPRLSKQHRRTCMRPTVHKTPHALWGTATPRSPWADARASAQTHEKNTVHCCTNQHRRLVDEMSCPPGPGPGDTV